METIDVKIRNVLGNQLLEILRLQARIDVLETQIKASAPPAPDQGAPS